MMKLDDSRTLLDRACASILSPALPAERWNVRLWSRLHLNRRHPARWRPVHKRRNCPFGAASRGAWVRHSGIQEKGFKINLTLQAPRILRTALHDSRLCRDAT